MKPRFKIKNRKTRARARFRPLLPHVHNACLLTFSAFLPPLSYSHLLRFLASSLLLRPPRFQRSWRKGSTRAHCVRSPPPSRPLTQRSQTGSASASKNFCGVTQHRLTPVCPPSLVPSKANNPTKQIEPLSLEALDLCVPRIFPLCPLCLLCLPSRAPSAMCADPRSRSITFM